MTPKDGVTTFILIGHPVSHSLSPAIHHAAYAQLDLPGHRYVTVDCPDESQVSLQIERLRRGEIAGANVTVPWKRLALRLADEVDPAARETGAVNVLTASGGRVSALNTDVPALAEELGAGVAAPRSAVILGSGGAALAAVSALKSLGATSIGVAARRFEAADPAGTDEARALVALGATPLPWPRDPSGNPAFTDAVLGADLLVQTTSDGMRGATDGTAVRDAIPWPLLSPDTFVYDVVYNPATTPFVAAALARGLRAESGLGMLVGQAVLALEAWLGVCPAREPLRQAAERAIAERLRS